MNKVLVVAKEYPEYYNKELYVLWTSETPNGKFYHCSDVKDDVMCKVYLGEKQVKILNNE